MIKKYDQQKHQELFKYSQDLINQGKCLSIVDNTKYIELLRYASIVYNQLNWNMRYEFVNLFQEFLTNKISSSDFCNLLTEKLELNDELANKVHCDNRNENADQFSEFIDNLSFSCEVIDRIPESFTNLSILPDHITETQFRDEVENIFFQLERLLNFKNKICSLKNEF